jgi:hypothetical protein
MVSSAREYKWSSFEAFYNGAREPVAIDREWWWEDDVRKLSVAMAQWNEELLKKDKK